MSNPLYTPPILGPGPAIPTITFELTSSVTFTSTTSTPPSTSATPTMTPQSSTPTISNTSTPPSTSATPPTTPNLSTPSTTTSNTPTPPSTSAIPPTTPNLSTHWTTTSNIQTLYGSTIVVTTETSTIPVPTSSPVNNNSSNTSTIVGGVIGGIVAIALLTLLIFCSLRRRRRDEFSGNFDPYYIISHPSGDRTLPQVDLGEENEITPNPDHSSSMRQYGESVFRPSGAGGASNYHTHSPLSPPSQYSANPTTAGTGYPSRGFMPGPAFPRRTEYDATTRAPSHILPQSLATHPPAVMQ
ncbi:hypothetical protein BDR07DRAFT_1424488 [Suillus spraguei]|nr:hypothetical protein BDR07DRAFT_1424488 [Suillus spraguei]